MTVSKKSWHYRLHCFVAKNLFGSNFKHPESASLCKYFWSVMGSIFLGLPFIAITGLFMGIIKFLIYPIFMLFMGHYPTRQYWLECNIAAYCMSASHQFHYHTYYRHAPLAYAILAALVMSIHDLYFYGLHALQWTFGPITLISLLFLCVLVIYWTFNVGLMTLLNCLLALVHFQNKISSPTSTGFNLFWEFWKANKQKVCPLISFIDD